MALSVVAQGASCLSSASLPLSTDASLLVDDIRVAIMSISNTTITTPSGWNLIDNTVITATRRIYRFWRRVTADGDAAHTFTAAAANNYGLVWSGVRGADLTTPIDTTGGTDAGTTGTTLTAPEISTVTLDTLLLFTAHAFTNSAAATLSNPAGMTSVVHQPGNGSNGHVARMSSEARAATGLTGTRATTLSPSSPGGATLLAIRPAAAEPPGIWLGHLADAA